MAKRASKKKPKRSAKTSNPDLWNFYQLGLSVLANDQKLANQSSKALSVQEFCEKKDISRSSAEKARSFADSFTEKEVKWYCSQMSDDPRPKPLITKCHMHRIITLPKKADRKKYAKLVCEQGWSVRRLSAEIAKIRPKSSQGGMRPLRPQTTEDSLLTLDNLSGQWLRYFEVLHNAEEGTSGVSLKDLPPTLRKSLTSTTAELQSLHKKVTRQLERRMGARSTSRR